MKLKSRMRANKIILSELRKIGVKYKNMNMQQAAEIVASHHKFFPAGRIFTKIQVAELLDRGFANRCLAIKPSQAVGSPRAKEIRRSRSPTEGDIKAFYASWEWKRLSYEVKLERGRKCECCGAQAPQVQIKTDHVKPIRRFWHLRMDKTNLQVLCNDCNMGKGSWDETDFRIGLSAEGPIPEPERVIWDT